MTALSHWSPNLLASCLATLACLLAPNASRAAPSIGKLPGSLADTYQYHLYPPNSSPQNPGSPSKWPLIIYLHGGGERGRDLAKLAAHGPPLLLATQSFPLAKRPFFLVTPQCPPTCRGWDPKLVEQLRQHLVASHPIDSRRVTITGQSMGGIGSFRTLAAYGQNFAAGLILCGAAPASSAAAFVGIPLWLIHGTLDPVIPVSGSRQVVTELKKLGGQKFRYDELPDSGHMIHNETYRRAEVWQWLLAQKLP